MTELEALRDRVRAATGPDHELGFSVVRCVLENDDEAVIFWEEQGEPDASIDAALGLVERVLPGWSAQSDLNTIDDTDMVAALWNGKLAPDVIEALGSSFVSAPLAILDALLTALIEKEYSDK